MSVLGAAGVVSLVLVGAGAAAAVVRLVRGPGTPDRAVATDVLVTALVCGLLVAVAVTGATTWVPLLLVLALLGFVSSSTLARFLRGGARPVDGRPSGGAAGAGDPGGTDGAGDGDGPGDARGRAG